MKKNKVKIYENVFIGSFIYNLGLLVGYKNEGNNSSINLFQQSPVDPVLSDLVTSINYKFLVLEFKREEKDKKEIVKAKELENFINSIKDTETKEKIIEISKQCHFMAVGEVKENKEAIVRVYKYYDYMIENNEVEVKDYLNRYIDSDDEIGENKDNFSEYTKILQEIYKTNRNISTSGLIMTRDKKDEKGEEGYGPARFIPTDDIESLIINIDKPLNSLRQEKLFKLPLLNSLMSFIKYLLLIPIKLTIFILTPIYNLINMSYDIVYNYFKNLKM
ncbi:MAG: hypothetical protein CL624_07775 [Arcobacter sp.]|mgnify:CR=1 FL=1|nr:hypothetical protein [Arcobacter sp.]|tara:strand:+ start:3189 stop:4016 length:828 start_codon:yes stop_codon:yes gene_type:complete